MTQPERIYFSRLLMMEYSIQKKKNADISLKECFFIVMKQWQEQKSHPLHK